MPETSRRDLFKALAAGALVAPLSALASPAAVEAACSPVMPRWGRGPEGQRSADLGDGTYLNPIVAGDHPDPSILKDGDDYYMTFSSFYSYPGLVIWHST
ncbi:family 43 glycosylhydrolase, partial [Stenotrophomonas sp.]|uniref:family 43 glycosylhydrolase n=1 Tax=Stenotrophomonas sp. TaxID=69392 RepID=UPI0028B1C82C